MKFNISTLPSTFIPGTNRGNMSPQMLPEAQINNSNMQAKMTTNKGNNSKDSKQSYNTNSGRVSGKRLSAKSRISRSSEKPRGFKFDSSNNNVNINVNSSSSNYDTGRWGYNAKESTPITISSGKMSLFTNPALPGEFDTKYSNVALAKLAVNVITIDPLGYRRTIDLKNSVARENFLLIYARIVSTLANNPAKAYKDLFQNVQYLIVYFTNIFNLLNRYYEIESVLAWKPKETEYNVTLDQMRKVFDRSDIFFLKIDLVEHLMRYYIPMEFVNLANYFNQTYKTGVVSGSKLFKFMSPELANAFRDNNTTAYITKVREQLAAVNAASDDLTGFKLSAYTMAQITGFLDKDFSFGRKYSTGLPPAANCANHDLDAYNIFINQRVLYSNTSGATTTYYGFPDYESGANTPYVSHKEGDDTSIFELAFQGVSSGIDASVKTGFLVEDSIIINSVGGQNRMVNKLYFTSNPDGTIKVYTRSGSGSNIFNDFHFVDLASTFPFTKVSIPPSHTHLLYQNGDPIKDVATRSFSNKIFGNI